ncbi:hypothetical protein PISMIDRAFT_676724 [Pisolithus microcarpus 441]|uniref:Uncharacterized protein n=1 Tax=Pisolithus microcarpus 441 TaxID=765257 RepID=A0A0C9ZU67_9AGAM|nr:hypothetical protein PISMIDRAFT_676724 [Pisolithus microcarpus 441]
MSTKTFLSTVTVATLFEASASAICPRYNFGITQTWRNTNPDEDHHFRTGVHDSSDVVNQVIEQNPRTVGFFDCSLAPNTTACISMASSVNFPSLLSSRCQCTRRLCLPPRCQLLF